jgi:hypothetical protein
MATPGFSSVKTDAIGREDWMFGGVGLLLVIDLLFLPWFHFSIGPYSSSLSATAVLATVAAVADLGIERLSPQTTLPMIRGSRAMTRLTLTGLAALFVALKFLFHIHFSLFGFGFWVAVVLTAAFVFLARRSNASGVSAGGTVG